MTIEHKDMKQGVAGRWRRATSRRTRQAAAWAGSVMTMAAIVLGAAAPAAQAAGFIPVSICRTADGEPAISPDVRFAVSDPGGISADVAEDRCAQGGALELSMGAGSAHEGNLSLGIDGPGTYPSDKNANFFNVVMWRSVILDASSNAAAYYQLQTGMGSGYGFEQCGTRQQCSSRGSESAAPLSDTNRYALTADGTDGHGYVQVNTGCSVPNYSLTYDPPYSFPCPATTGPRIRTRIYRIAFSAADPTPPVFNGAPSGPLANPGATVRGTQTISYSAGDPSSSRSGAGGVWKAEILVDGQSQATQIADPNGGLCKMLGDGSFASATPCKTAVTASVSLDTSRFANGPHKIAVRLTDAASNVTTSSPSTVTIANPATNTGKPTLVATGTGSLVVPKQGDTLSSTLGNWAPDGVELKRQWLRCDEQANACEPIIGATGETYKLAGQDVSQTFRVRVDGSNAVGASSAPSDASGVVAAAAPTGGGGGGGATTGPTSPGGDFDGDGISNNTDQDDDNDGTPDTRDPAPYDGSIPARVEKAPGVPTTSGTAPGNDAGPGAASKVAGGRNGEYAEAGAKLTALFAKRRGTKGISRFGQSATIRGRLTTKSGQPITGARLDLRYVTGTGKTSDMSGTTTRADGGFSLKLPSNIGSRRMIMRYRYDAGHPEADVEQTLALQVQAAIGLSVKRSQGRLVFHGRAGIPGTSKARRQVTIDYRVGRGAWRPFVRTRTTRTGRFSVGFRPAARLVGRVQFRAVIGSGSNVEGGASRVRGVRFSR